jgi:hypothetical protein
MNQFFERIGHAITSMAAVIFVLVMTIIAMIFFSHTLFYEIFPPEMAEWEKSIATWTLACAWELTVLITTCNTQFIHRRIPIAMAICSGFIILLFIHGFDTDLSGLEYFKRWFVGILVATINIVFSGLFYSKWKELKTEKNLQERLLEMDLSFNSQNIILVKTKDELTKAKADFDQLFTYTEELESFKAKEMEKLKCPYCHGQYETIFKLTSHKGVCNQNPKKGMKQSVFEEV